MRSPGLTVAPIAGLPLVGPGDALADMLIAALDRDGGAIADGDVVVVAQKIVSKAEGRTVDLAGIAPGEEARRLEAVTGKPAPLIELILRESAAVLRAVPNVLITRHRAGHVLANAGIDASNVAGAEEGMVLLWPSDPDASARRLHAAIRAATGRRIGVVIADSLGRAWRIGTTGTAIGASGLRVTDDRRGQADLFGRRLQATIVAIADTVAAAAVLAMGEGAEGTPAAIVRGLPAALVHGEEGGGAAAIVRPAAEDLFP